MIKMNSEPCKDTWLQLPGRVKGKFKNRYEAEIFIQAKVGVGVTSSRSELERITAITSQAMDRVPIASNNECELSSGKSSFLMHSFF